MKQKQWNKEHGTAMPKLESQIMLQKIILRAVSYPFVSVVNVPYIGGVLKP